MRVALVLFASAVLSAGAFAAGAAAAPPNVVAAASGTVGVAPYAVTLTATGDAAGYHWDLGDGAVADGPTVRHVYGPGRFVATLTAVGETGETALATIVLVVRQRTLVLHAPRSGSFGERIALGGSLQPAVAGARVQIYRGTTYVTSARVRADGRFRTSLSLRTPGRYEARYGAARSEGRSIGLRPKLLVSLAPAASVGADLTVSARLVPPRAGRVRIEIRRAGRSLAVGAGHGTLRLRVPTGRAGALHVTVSGIPGNGYAATRRSLVTEVFLPSLAPGSRGPSVLALERRLAELHYALRGADSLYATDTLEAVTAFQKVTGLARTGRVDASLWGRLATASIPKPRYSGADHIEVDKTRQVLYEVERGQVKRVIHVSTGATGNTPLGTWHVYRKVSGFDWVLWYPMYFLRGFAIHGYPSVPAYPASHGCVRVPMWIAPVLFAGHGAGATITIYL